MLNFKKITNNKLGILYNVKKKSSDCSLSDITYILFNTRTLFGLETRYNNKFFKWIIDDDIYNKILLLEKDLMNNNSAVSVDKIKSKIIEKNNYPKMIETNISKNTFCSNDIINHEKGIITSFDQINKNSKYNIGLKLATVSVRTINNKNILYYNLEITKIEECVNLI